MKPKKLEIPRISTRGYYDLSSGKKIKENKYYLYPKKIFQKILQEKEFVIMIHGLRNDKAGANQKFLIAKRRLKHLGYPYKVVGFSYDSNTKGAHLKKHELKALRVGQKIAKFNGYNLSKFVTDFKKSNPKIKIRLIGHSLGAEVILHTITRLGSNPKNWGVIESVHFFGSSITTNQLGNKKTKNNLQKIVKNRIKNYYSPNDEVLKESHENDYVKNPIGYVGTKKLKILKIQDVKVKPKNHRFVSYSSTLKSFP